MSARKAKLPVVGRCDGCDCPSETRQCPKCKVFGFGAAASGVKNASHEHGTRSVQRMARRLGVKLRIGNPGRRWGRYLCVTANGGPECDSAPGWEIVDWMPSLTDGKGFWYRQMFDGDVVGWMTLPALSKSPSVRVSDSPAETSANT